jgi:hypothetical protein
MATAPEDERLYVPQQREAGSALSRQRTADVAVRPPAEVVPAASPRHLTGGSRAGRGGRPELRLALIAVLAVIIIAVVTIATGALIAQVRSRSQGGTRPPGSQPTVQNPGGAGHQGSPAPLGPPTDLKLVDNATSIVLSWRYPAGAEGPVILSAGRPNEARHAFQTLAAGSQTFTVYSLPQTANYCFTVSIAYSTDDVAMSSPVCTARPGG